MARTKNPSYYEQFKANVYDKNALVQDYKGHILHYESGHVYVVRTFFGRYKVKNRKARLSFRWPFQQAKLVRVDENIGQISFSDDLVTGDGLNTTQGQPLDYQYEVVDKKKYYKKIFDQTDLPSIINTRVKDVVRSIINSGNLDDIRHNFSISRVIEDGNPKLKGPSWMDIYLKDLDGRYELDSAGNPIINQVYFDVLNKLNSIEEEYGIRIKNILSIDFNEPEEIRKSREAAVAAGYKRQEAEELNAIEADKAARKLKATLEAAKEFAIDNNLSDSVRDQLLIRLANPNANYTTTSFDIGAAASVLQNSQSQTSALQQMVTQQAATIQTLTQQIASMNAAIESMRAALQSQPVVNQPQPTVQSQAQRVTAQAQQATAQAQQATAQAQQATAQAQQVTAQAQQATAQAQQTTAQAQQPVVDQPQPATKKSAVDAALGNKKLVRITSANRVPKASRTNRNGGARGPVPTPRRRSAQTSATQGGRSLR